MTGSNLPYIPEYITVHLGTPNSDAANVTVPFSDYIKNVASSEIYPTWPENALRANILAEISYALNRVYTEYYRNQGYDFEITNSTAYDQSYINGREIFSNISEIVDGIFTNYLARQGAVEPLFAQYCDGVATTCDGLSQWGSVSLAENGLVPYEILTRYYGNNINIITDAVVRGISESYPGRILDLGSSGNDVKLMQVKLNRISKNYPNIPKIRRLDGIFGGDTENAVLEFQRQFGLTPDGKIGRVTWYKIGQIYNAVKRLSDLNSEGITLEEITGAFSQTLSEGDRGNYVVELQYLINIVSQFINTIPEIAIDGIFGSKTRAAVEAAQKHFGLPVTGTVNTATWEAIYRTYRGIVNTLPDGYFGAETIPYPGFPLNFGSEGDEVAEIQILLNYISNTYTEIPRLAVDGIYGPATENAVRIYQQLFGIPDSGIVAAATWASIASTYRALYEGNQTSRGQFSGEA